MPESVFTEARSKMVEKFDVWAAGQDPNDFISVEDILLEFFDQTSDEIVGGDEDAPAEPA